MTTPVGPRASKEEFMRAIGLTAGDIGSDRLYQAMRDEAIAVYHEFKNDDLLEPHKSDSNIRPPFFYHHIRPERQQWAVNQIWERSRGVVRERFSYGWTNGENSPNWVIVWLLYSVFRSRDERNRRRKADGAGAGSGAAGSGGGASSAGSRTKPSDGRYIFDPVRGC